MSDTECQVSDWTAVAIQEAFQQRKREHQAARDAVALCRKSLQGAEDQEKHFAKALDELKADAKRLGITAS